MKKAEIDPSSVIELQFPIRGKFLASDHGYKLYSAVSQVIPEAHKADWLGIHTIKGSRFGPGVIRISADAKLCVRLPAAQVPMIYKLAGKILGVGDHLLRCGIPQVSLLQPSNEVRSRLVVIKVKDSRGRSAEPDSFLRAVSRQVSEMGIGADVELETEGRFAKALARRVLRIKGVILTGYGVVLRNLSEVDSLKVQAWGLGGRRRMGCGLFVPCDGSAGFQQEEDGVGSLVMRA